jgi:hypothetical protein
MPRRSFVSYVRRYSNKAHGSELPFSRRYSEGITSTTQGRGVRTQALYPGLCIHLGQAITG